jgi:hypothetical protein
MAQTCHCATGSRMFLHRAPSSIVCCCCRRATPLFCFFPACSPPRRDAVCLLYICLILMPAAPTPTPTRMHPDGRTRGATWQRFWWHCSACVPFCLCL